MEGRASVTMDRPISRREFLKIAGTAGAVVGLGAGLGSLVEACTSTGQTSRTVATIAVEETNTSTTAVAAPETGRDLKIGVVSARSGPLALFGRADDWWTRYAAAACPGGVLCGDHQLHRLTFIVEDSRSDPGTAAQAADRLITESGVDLITCSGGADLVVPVADRAEALGCPCLSSFHQWRPFVFDRAHSPEPPFKWTYAHAFGLEDIAANYLAMWGQVETNKKVGFVFKEDANGRLWADSATGLPPAAAALGYECLVPGLLPRVGGDYGAHITDFLKNGCEICCVALSTREFIDFWSRSSELGYKPRIVTAGDALVFPQALEAVGAGARDLTAESYWQPTWPFTDSVTGASAEQLAGDYMARTGEQWIAPLALYAKFEWMVDVFKRVGDLESKETIVARVRTTRLNTCLGTIDFTAPVDTSDLAAGRRPAENVCKAPVVGVQWVHGDTFRFEPVTVANGGLSGLPVMARVQPMVYG